MRANKTATPAQLRLNSVTPGIDAKSSLEAALGDPAYLHEMEASLAPWSRKQIEKAASALLAEGRIVRYGMNTRRLYASPRTIPAVLQDAAASHVRLLQYMPQSGATTIGRLNIVMSQVAPMIYALSELGMVMRLPGHSDVVMLTQAGAETKATLGNGLALKPMTIQELDDATTTWYPTLKTLGRYGSLSKPKEMLSRLVNLGLARRLRNHFEITQEGRHVYDTRQDLEQITNMIDQGVDQSHAAFDYVQKHQESIVRISPAATAPSELEHTDLYAYLLVRTDMPSLGMGKSRSQCMHAGNHMTHQIYVEPLLRGEEPDPKVIQWHAQGGGFGTAIAIGARNQITRKVLEQTIKYADLLGFQAGLVVDESYPYEVDAEVFELLDPEVHTKPPTRTRSGWRCYRSETTAGWILGNKGELQPLLAQFDLTPARDADERR